MPIPAHVGPCPKVIYPSIPFWIFLLLFGYWYNMETRIISLSCSLLSWILEEQDIWQGHFLSHPHCLFPCWTTNSMHFLIHAIYLLWISFLIHIYLFIWMSLSQKWAPCNSNLTGAYYIANGCIFHISCFRFSILCPKLTGFRGPLCLTETSICAH